MRYVAKIHVLDVMEGVVISGYVIDADSLSNPDHEQWDFACTIDGLGLSDPMDWLMDALGRADLIMSKGPLDLSRGP
jgi:hypothetical protein